MLLEFKGLPVLVLLVKPLAKNRREGKGREKRQGLIKLLIAGCLGKRGGGWVALGLEQV